MVNAGAASTLPRVSAVPGQEDLETIKLKMMEGKPRRPCDIRNIDQVFAVPTGSRVFVSCV
jgi:hypothetical protein